MYDRDTTVEDNTNGLKLRRKLWLSKLAMERQLGIDKPQWSQLSLRRFGRVITDVKCVVYAIFRAHQIKYM
jgi:hypothetical protein